MRSVMRRGKVRLTEKSRSNGATGLTSFIVCNILDVLEALIEWTTLNVNIVDIMWMMLE
jgi:hypothetical protein